MRLAVMIVFALCGAVPAGGAYAQSPGSSGEAAEPDASPSDVPGPFDQPSPGEVRDQAARQLFEAGRLQFSAGDFEGALDAFQRAHRLSGRPELLFNIGTSLDRLRRNEEALDFFGRYLRALPAAPNRAEVQGRIAALRASLERARRTRDAHERERERLIAERRQAEEGGGLLSRWWFWTIVGALVAGGVVAAVLLIPGDDLGQPVEGNIPGITMTLRAP